LNKFLVFCTRGCQQIRCNDDDDDDYPCFLQASTNPSCLATPNRKKSKSASNADEHTKNTRRECGNSLRWEQQQQQLSIGLARSLSPHTAEPGVFQRRSAFSLKVRWPLALRRAPHYNGKIAPQHIRTIERASGASTTHTHVVCKKNILRCCQSERGSPPIEWKRARQETGGRIKSAMLISLSRLCARHKTVSVCVCVGLHRE
jgi:hypothetical protein